MVGTRTHALAPPVALAAWLIGLPILAAETPLAPERNQPSVERTRQLLFKRIPSRTSMNLGSVPLTIVLELTENTISNSVHYTIAPELLKAARVEKGELLVLHEMILPRLSGACLADWLDIVVERIQLEDGRMATCRIVPGGVEIFPAWGPEPVAPPTISGPPHRPLEERLDRLIPVATRENGPNWNFADLIRYLSIDCDLDLVVNHQEFLSLGFPDLNDVNVAVRRSKEGRPGREVLEEALRQLECGSFTGGYIVHRGYIEIVPQLKTIANRKPLDQAEFDQLFAKLGSLDARIARLAYQNLTMIPKQAGPALAERLKPAPKTSGAGAEQVGRWLDALDARSFEDREAATQELARAGRPIVPTLRQRLRARPSPEACHRLEDLLKEFEGPPDVAERGALRAVHVLKQINTPEARQLLARLADGEPSARQTEEARAALTRLAP
jgi:hypothetical protein